MKRRAIHFYIFRGFGILDLNRRGTGEKPPGAGDEQARGHKNDMPGILKFKPERSPRN